MKKMRKLRKDVQKTLLNNKNYIKKELMIESIGDAIILQVLESGCFREEQNKKVNELKEIMYYLKHETCTELSHEFIDKIFKVKE